MIKSIAIIGGGLAGWTAALTLADGLKKQDVKIIIVDVPVEENKKIAESSLSSISQFHKLFKLNERELIAKTCGTFKLGVQYNDWVARKSFIHTFSSHGNMIKGVEFQHYVNLMQQCGDSRPFNDYSLAAQAGAYDRFTLLTTELEKEGFSITYGLHLETESYVNYIAKYAQFFGVTVTGSHSQVEYVVTNANSGEIESVILQDGTQVDSDFFVDCTGDAATLIGTVAPESYISVEDRLPVNASIQASSEKMEGISCVTKITATDDGWIKEIPLRDKIIKSYHYSSRFCSEGSAAEQFKKHLSPESVLDKKEINLPNGYRKTPWKKNCLALGASACNFGDLVISPLHLIQSGILRFVELMSCDDNSSDFIHEYNHATINEYNRIVDFHQVHFLLASERKSEFWQTVKTATISEELMHKIDLFKQRGNVAFYENETITPKLWTDFFLGMGIWPENIDPQLNKASLEDVAADLKALRIKYLKVAELMPAHDQFLDYFSPL